MKITFYGAAQNVTGSKHLIETDNGLRVLLDCGLHQGPRSEVNRLNRQLPFQAKSIDAVLLSHGHADHCGMLPLLVQQGFTGKIYATPATCDVANYIMKDSAKIQEQDANYFNDHLPLTETPINPIYTLEDVEKCLPYFEPTPYFRQSRQWTRLSPHVRFQFLDAGHILGSSVMVLEIQEGQQTRTLAFTGDLGHTNTPILRDPEIPGQPVNILLSECTYGNRVHKPLEEATKLLVETISRSVQVHGKIIIPSFSLGRTQELVYILHQLTDRKLIPRLPIYIDSPLAADMTEVFRKHPADFDVESKTDFARPGEWPLIFRNLTYTRSVEESKRLNTLPGPIIIISASGMCEGGRILHHLKNGITDPHNTILFTGYQASGTLGRKIIEGQTHVKIFGQEYQVRAEIIKANEFSAHADQKQLLTYISAMRGLEQIYLVHTEEKQAVEFTGLLQHALPDVAITTPHYLETVQI